MGHRGENETSFDDGERSNHFCGYQNLHQQQVTTNPASKIAESETKAVMLGANPGRTLFFDLDMKKKVELIMIVCDSCGEHYNDGNDMCCYINDTDGSDIEQEALDSCWIKVGDKHYCDKCYSIDEDDNIVTKDGYKYNPETLTEI